MSNALELFKNDVIDRKARLNVHVSNIKFHGAAMRNMFIFWAVLSAVIIFTTGFHTVDSKTDIFISGFGHGFLLWLHFWVSLFGDEYLYLPQQVATWKYNLGFYFGLLTLNFITLLSNIFRLQLQKHLSESEVLVEWLERDLESLEILSGATKQK
jgi:hypothetical protein